MTLTECGPFKKKIIANKFYKLYNERGDVFDQHCGREKNKTIKIKLFLRTAH